MKKGVQVAAMGTYDNGCWPAWKGGQTKGVKEKHPHMHLKLQPRYET